MKRQRISIWGSTGSIGTQTLEVVRKFPERFQIVVLAAHRNAEMIFRQAGEFNPDRVILTGPIDPGWQEKFRQAGIRLDLGHEALMQAAAAGEEDMVVNGLVGGVGLTCTVRAMETGTDIALANKEVLVMAGELIGHLQEKSSVRLVPVDSEHSAVFQCLKGEPAGCIRRIILTASGGPFREWSGDQLVDVTVEQALAHPNWDMGAKITIDSATMINKALEIIEARWLFKVEPSRIEVVIHPQSILHSMVEFTDGSLKAQLSVPDMRVPIGYALSCPDRFELPFGSLDLTKIHHLELIPPDFDRFPALRLAYEVLNSGGTAPAVLNAADEVAVQAFRDRRIGFLQITELIEQALSKHNVRTHPDLDEILAADRWARETTHDLIRSIDT